ncbi:hypothetical protein EFW57_01015 [Bacillus velezensis]|nr:hypothetical protein EFW57_01015 [Bacillus velezensis]
MLHLKDELFSIYFIVIDFSEKVNTKRIGPLMTGRFFICRQISFQSL